MAGQLAFKDDQMHQDCAIEFKDQLIGVHRRYLSAAKETDAIIGNTIEQLKADGRLDPSIRDSLIEKLTKIRDELYKRSTSVASEA